MKYSLLILFVFVLTSCQNSGQKSANRSTVISHAPEDEAIKKAVDEAYSAISFKKGEQVPGSSIKIYFIPQAQLIDFRNDSLEILTIDQFINVYKTSIESNGVTLFYEEEIKGTTDQFGRIAQRISTYKTYINSMNTVAERGVNSFQLIKTSQGWKVSSIIWDVESSKLRIPAYYLTSDTAR